VIIEAVAEHGPAIDPVAAVVLSADVSNVDTVFVAGRSEARWKLPLMSTRLALMWVSRSRLRPG
jgi:hypothetical protein